MIRFSASSKIIESVLQEMKKNDYIDPAAEFNYGSNSQLRREVTYRDSDFMYFLGHSKAEEELVDELLQFLIQQNTVPSTGTYDR